MKTFLLWSLFIFTTASQAAVQLAEGGKTQHVIVVDPAATPPEHTAAKELAATLRQITGAEFLVQTGHAGCGVRVTADASTTTATTTAVVTRRRGNAEDRERPRGASGWMPTPKSSLFFGVWMERSVTLGRVARPREPRSAFPRLRVNHCRDSLSRLP